MSLSFLAWPGDLRAATSSTSLFPINKQTPLACVEKRGDRSTWL
jgi:hypothetical protein